MIFDYWLEKLSSGFKPYECKVFSVSIQKSSRFFNRSVDKSLSIFILSSCLIKVNLECWLKFWLGRLNCWSACGSFCLLTSLQWLFKVMLNSVFDFPMYWKRQILHSKRYVSSLLLQLRPWKIWYIFCIWSEFQLLVIALFTLGNVRLYVNTITIQSLSSFYTLVYFLLFVSTFN